MFATENVCNELLPGDSNVIESTAYWHRCRTGPQLAGGGALHANWLQGISEVSQTKDQTQDFPSCPVWGRLISEWSLNTRKKNHYYKFVFLLNDSELIVKSSVRILNHMIVYVLWMYSYTGASLTKKILLHDRINSTSVKFACNQLIIWVSVSVSAK